MDLMQSFQHFTASFTNVFRSISMYSGQVSAKLCIQWQWSIPIIGSMTSSSYFFFWCLDNVETGNQVKTVTCRETIRKVDSLAQCNNTESTSSQLKTVCVSLLGIEEGRSQAVFGERKNAPFLHPFVNKGSQLLRGNLVLDIVWKDSCICRCNFLVLLFS